MLVSRCSGMQHTTTFMVITSSSLKIDLEYTFCSQKYGGGILLILAKALMLLTEQLWTSLIRKDFFFFFFFYGVRFALNV
jgi:hypothetical protein